MDILRRMRALGAEVRAIEIRLANSPPSRHLPLLRRLDRIFAERERVMSEWIDDRLAQAATSGVKTASSTIGAGYEISSLMALTIREIQKQTFAEVAASTRFMSQDARRFIRQVIALQTEIHTARGLSVPESAKIVAGRMRGGGIRAFIDRAGRAWRLESYSSMLVRTRTAEAYSTGTILRSQELGVHAFEVFDGMPSGHAPCLEKNGWKVSARWAMDHRIEHPNCVRGFGPLPAYFGELDAA